MYPKERRILSQGGILLFLFFLSPLYSKEVVVTAPRLSPVPLKEDQISFWDWIHPKKEREETLAEILAGEKGVQIRNFGGLGKLSTISLRGFSAQQVKVYLDGFPLNTAQNGSVDFSNIPLGAVKRVSVLRGGDGARFGSGAVGGVVWIETGAEKDGGNIALTYGSFRTARLQIQGQKKWSSLSLLLALELFHTGGRYPYWTEEVRIGGITISESRKKKRENNRSEFASLLAKTRWKILPSLTLDLLWESFLAEKEIPGSENYPLPRAREKDWRTLLGGKLTWDKETVVLQWKGFFKLDGLAFQDPTPTLGREINSLYNNFSQGQEVLFQRFLEGFGEHLLTTGFYWQTHWLKSNTISPPVRHLTRMFAQNVWGVSPYLTLSAAASLEWASDVKKLQAGGKIGAKLQVGKFAFLVNGRRYYRFPDFNELYYPNLGFVRGNPKLKEESGFGAEGGVSARFSSSSFSLQGEVVYFYQNLKNWITWVYISPFTLSPLNSPPVWLQGVESSLKLSLPYLTFKGSYTFLEPHPKVGEELPGRSRHTGRVEVIGKLDFLRLYLLVIARGKVPLNLYGTRWIEEQYQINTGIALTFPQGGLSLEVKNVEDKTLRDLRGFPLPGRSIFLKAYVRF